MNMETTSRAFFDGIYARDSDPWNFASSAYELGRYERILQALPRTRYKRAFEPGCSIGVLTEQLASVCDTVEAIDISPVAVDRAIERCSKLGHVDIQRGTLPKDIPAGQFDLIVFSEIGYYFEAHQLQPLLNQLTTHLDNNGTFLASHWLGSSPDHLLGGDQVHQAILGIDELTLEHSERHAEFLLERWAHR
jgi:SAM-dependent methyltransferase